MTTTVNIDDEIVAKLVQSGLGATAGEAIERAVSAYFAMQAQADACDFFARGGMLRDDFTNEQLEAEEMAEIERRGY